MGWSSPELRHMTANLLRVSATWIEPKPGAQKTPEHFKIPNPFFTEK